MELFYRTKVYANGVLLKKLSSKKQGRISHVINKYDWDECHLTVVYGKNELDNNSGVYKSKEEARYAFTTFTEKRLIDYINDPQSVLREPDSDDAEFKQ